MAAQAPQTIPTQPEQTIPTQPGRRTERPVSDAVADALSSVHAGDLVALLQDLLAVPSVTGSAAESEAQHLLEPVLRSAGMETDLWRIDLPAVTADPDFPGMEVDRDEAWGLVGTWRGGDGPCLVLNGHLDVVPAGEVGWTVPSPWGGTVRDGRVLGRGACDMKAGLACQLTAIRVLQRAGVRLSGSVQLQSVVGEEDGGLGTFATLRRGYRGDLAVICEPTSGRVVTASAGALTFRLTVLGRSAHASSRLEGVDAVEAYLHVREALVRLEQQRNARPHALMAGHRLPYPLSIGTLSAGNWASSVPDRLVAEGRLGVALGETVAQARTALERAVRECCAGHPWLRHHPVTVEWWGGQFAPGFPPASEPEIERVVRAAELVTGKRPDLVGAPYGSDQRLLSGLGGIPTVLYGPGDVRRAHAPDESVPVHELVTVTRTLVQLIASTCGEAA